ncbi:MAG TPA: hypothetical protein VF432_22315 [Thermoanaerobaculia bacterium]
MRFGRQRSPSEVTTILMLFLGFTGLAAAFWILTLNWAGLLLPLGFLIGLFGTFRAEVKEIELRGETLILRTFFRAYPIPRAHVTKIVRTPRGPAIEVLNGNRYDVTPPGTNAEEVARALEAWLREKALA